MMIILINIEYTFGIFLDKLKMLIFINILTGMETASCEIYVAFKKFANINLKYSKNDKLIVYKSQ